MPALPRPLIELIKVLAAILALPALPLIALRARRTTAARRATGVRARLIWGPTPIISLRNWSRGMRALGYDSTTLVWAPYAIHARADYDRIRADAGPPGRWFEPWRDYAMLATALRADVLLTFFDGVFLQNTPLGRLEPWLLRLAGTRLVLSPYGSDFAVAGHLAGWEQAMAIDYPQTVANADRIRARVDRMSGAADVIVRNINPGYQPRWDVLWPNQFTIDPAEFRPGASGSGDGRSGPVTVVHAPNHRALKGTGHVIAATETLQGEGLDVRLELLEKRPNTEVRDALRDADIVVDQLLVGYGLFAVEACASGSAVLSNTGWADALVQAHPAMRECPIVDANVETITARLRELVTDPERRARLGAQGRDYAVRWHSDAASARTWEAIVEALMTGAPLPSESLPARPTAGGSAP